jgi:hypothetical protein
LWKDVFLFHWKEEAQHAIVDELEFERANSAIQPRARDAAVGDLIDLVGALDGILQVQATADWAYFMAIAASPLTAAQQVEVHGTVLKAYRWQYLVSGAMQPRFRKVLFGMLDTAQAGRIDDAFAPFAYAVPIKKSREPQLLKAA